MVRNRLEANDRAFGAIVARLKAFAEHFDRRFAEAIDGWREVPNRLHEAVRYSALAPGKRVRPFLVNECCLLVGGTPENAWPAAQAIECVHAFSLIHDDLPAMDDDDWRRGRPTCHKQFGEGLAILAGDALLNFAFELLANADGDPGRSIRLVRELAWATGWTGMIGGQALDIEFEAQASDLELTTRIHDLKTARLFRAACRLGAVSGGGSEEQIERLGRFGEKLGRAFQIADDLLDVTPTVGEVGAVQGSDQKKGKQTLPACVGVVEARRIAEQTVEDAVAELDPIGEEATALRQLGQYVVFRDY